MLGESTQKFSDWIHSKPEDDEIPWDEPLADFFPNGPHDKSKRLVDIVVVTPEGTSCRANPYHLL